MKDLYTDNYKTLMKETKQDLNNGKASHVHGLEDLILVRYQNYLKQYLPNSDSLFCRNRKVNPQIHMEL